MWHACAVHHLKDRRKQLAFIQCMLRFLLTVHPQQHHPCFQLVFISLAHHHQPGRASGKLHQRAQL